MADPALSVGVRREPRRAMHPAMSQLIVGGVCGLAWAAGLRGMMAEIAGPGADVDWSLTFGWILLPGVIVGVLLGWAEQLRRTGGRPRWRWLALASLS